MTGQSPAVSVIIATMDSYDSIRKTISHVCAQTVADTIEVIIVAPSAEQLGADGKSAPFTNMQVVETGPIESIGAANASGIRNASADIVVLAEDHCFPEPGWAAALIDAHRGDWAAVGPGVRNANPATAVSWADLFIGYGPWLLPTPGGEAEFLPGHNTSYKREVLLQYGEDLDSLMDAETVLHWKLRSDGFRLLLEPRAVVAHTNFSLWRSWLPVQFYNGRMFAGSRMTEMPGWKRLMYAAGSPLIPLVRLARIARQAKNGKLLGRFAACFHALVPGLLLDGAGQFLGYTFGAGNARERVANYEFRRIEHITDGDRKLVYQAENKSRSGGAR